MPISSRVGFVLALGMMMTQGVGAQERTYPGSMCTEVETGPVNQKAKISRNADGEIFNLSPSHALQVVCPVSGLFNDNSGGTANVWVHDRSTSDEICCTTSANNVGFVLSSDPACSTGVDDRLQTLSLTPPVMNFTFTSRYFTCTIPPADKGQASGIRLYRY